MREKYGAQAERATLNERDRISRLNSRTASNIDERAYLEVMQNKYGLDHESDLRSTEAEDLLNSVIETPSFKSAFIA
jgi:hypothetical protein